MSGQAAVSRAHGRLHGSLGRQDLWQIRHAPACANEWRADVYEKPRIKCSDCRSRLLLPVSDTINATLNGLEPITFVLHGRMSKKQRSALVATLDALPPNAPRVLLSTGKLVGEGFDHPPLDTLLLAMPVSWKGTLQQYAGRLHREHPNKTTVRIIDFVDTGQPTLLRMWDKRQHGYRAMGYRVESDMPAE